MTKVEAPSVEPQLRLVCPDCSSAALERLGPCQKPVELNSHGLGFAPEIVKKMESSMLYACKTCGMYFRYPQLSKLELEALYRDLPSDYWSDEGAANPAWSLARNYLIRRFGESAQPAVLDVGAFNGGFLRSLPDNWKKSAIEPSKQAGEALPVQGVELIGHFLHDASLSGHKYEFDAITLLDVLEHIPSPSEAIGRLVSMLKPGGVVLISTGNTLHWSWRLLNGHHWYLHSIQHCSFANRRYFKRLVACMNLSLKKVISHSHQRNSSLGRFRQSVEVVFAWGRTRTGLTRKVAGWLVYIPGLGNLRHKTAYPFSNSLRDHLLVMMEKPQTNLTENESHA